MQKYYEMKENKMSIFEASCNKSIVSMQTGAVILGLIDCSYGRVYDYTTNSAIATGDGITLAYEMGANIKNLSLIQFHPTAFNNKHTRECFLISEAVRGVFHNGDVGKLFNGFLKLCGYLEACGILVVEYPAAGVTPPLKSSAASKGAYNY